MSEVSYLKPFEMKALLGAIKSLTLFYRLRVVVVRRGYRKLGLRPYSRGMLLFAGNNSIFVLALKLV